MGPESGQDKSHVGQLCTHAGEDQQRLDKTYPLPLAEDILTSEKSSFVGSESTHTQIFAACLSMSSFQRLPDGSSSTESHGASYNGRSKHQHDRKEVGASLLVEGSHHVLSLTEANVQRHIYMNTYTLLNVST